MYCVKSVVTCFQRLAADRRAAIAPIFALLLLPLLGLMGFAVDLSTMMAERTRAHNIADAGALDALRIAQAYMKTNGYSQSSFNAIQTTAQQNAENFMNGMAKQDQNMTGIGPTAQLSFSNGTLKSNSTLTFTTPTAFMQLFGIPSYQESVDSVASQTLPKFTQVIFLVDVSGSMGIAATQSDMDQLVQLTSNLTGGQYPCQFACHQPSGGTPLSSYPPIDFRTEAKNANISLKIDFAQKAVGDFTTSLAKLNTQNSGYLTSAIYTFSGALNTVQAPTKDFSTVANAVPKIDLDMYRGDSNVPYYGGTSLTDVLTSMKSQITNVGKGDGSSASDQLTYLILVTDGVEDLFAPNFGCCNHYTDTTWVSACTGIKNLNVNIATVQAQYVQFNTETFTDLVAPLYDSITPAMQSCASSHDYALSASDGPGIESAVNTLFDNLFSSTPRLTN